MTIQSPQNLHKIVWIFRGDLIINSLIFNTIMIFFILVFWTRLSYAQFNGSRPPRDNARIILDYQSDVLNESSDRRLTERQKIAGADIDVNIYRSKKYTITVGGRIESLDTGSSNLQFGPETPVGRNLTDQVFTVSGKKTIDDKGRSLSMSLSYGSASDNSFGREKDSAVNLTAVYSLARGEKSQWLLVANYSNNRAFLNNIPLPSVFYLYMPSKKFIATIGFPFVSVNWMDYKTYSYKIFFSPVGGGFDLARQIYGPAMFYTKFEFQVETYMHENRQVEEDRLFYEDKKFEIGLKSFLSKNFQLSLGTGYSFDRKIYEGESIFDSDLDKQDLGKDIYMNTKLTIDF
jgi:hypothetical protein